MQINIFEGARRLALLVSLLAVVGAVALGASVSQYTTGNYRLYAPGDKLIATPESCDEPGSRLAMLDAATPKGRAVSISLCLVSMAFAQPDGTILNLVPYHREANGTYWGGEPYSQEVQGYVERLNSEFLLPPDEGNKLDLQYEKRRNSEWKSIAIGLALFLAVFWIGVVAVGWIVRGFAGIPRGKDSRPTTQDKK
ncbi:TPA: hypothetical protein UOJ25_000409 [Stenotrophomonas maltophilia]|nr:hypothetical protein [Stenotrophomonas maltophilia]